jgi:uncharacterized protein YjiS (DUF1127 family)
VPVFFVEIGPMDLLKNALRVWAMHREFRAVLAELNSYSDRELADLGIGRADVARLAYEEAERRIMTPPATSRDESSDAAWRNPVFAPGG